MTLQKGDRLKLAQWDDGMLYEIVSSPFYLTDAEGKESYVVAMVLKEMEQ